MNKLLIRRTLPLLMLAGLGIPAAASSWQEPSTSYFTYLDKRRWDVGFYLAPGIWQSEVDGVLLGGAQAGMTFRKRVPPGKLGSLIELGFQRYEFAASNQRRVWVGSGSDSFFLPTVFTWSLFVNGGRYSRQMGELAPLFGLGIALLHHGNLSYSNTVQHGAALFGVLGLEFAVLPPSFCVRLSARIGTESVSAQDMLAYFSFAKNAPSIWNQASFKFFFSVSAAFVFYLG